MCIAVRKLEKGHETGKGKRRRGAKGKDIRAHVGWGESRESSEGFGGMAVSNAQVCVNCPKETCYLVN